MRIVKNFAAAAAALVLVGSLAGCQLAADTLNGAAEQARQQEQAENQSGSAPADGTVPSKVTASAEGRVVRVIRVVDGDTIAVEPTADFPATNESGTEHVIRMLGIDTPEMNKSGDKPAECGAQDAMERLASLLHSSTEVSVVFDAKADRTDRFGRSLAYVQLIDDRNTDLAFIMALDGYAEAWYPQGEPEPERFAQYEQASKAAEDSGAGAYGTCDSIGR
jgi:micrococcal nuclease